MFDGLPFHINNSFLIDHMKFKKGISDVRSDNIILVSVSNHDRKYRLWKYAKFSLNCFKKIDGSVGIRVADIIPLAAWGLATCQVSMIRGQKYQQYILGKDFNAVKRRRSYIWAIFDLLNRMIFSSSRFAYIVEAMRWIYSLRHRVLEEASDSYSNNLRTLHLFWYCRCTTWGGHRQLHDARYRTVVHDMSGTWRAVHESGVSHEWCITWVLHHMSGAREGVSNQ